MKNIFTIAFLFLIANSASANTCGESEVISLSAVNQAEPHRKGVKAQKSAGSLLKSLSKAITFQGLKAMGDAASGAMYFCMAENGPVSSNNLDDTANCISIGDVAGVRLSAQIYTPGSHIVITEIDYDGNVVEEVIDAPLEVEKGENIDICLEEAQTVKVITVHGKSSNSEGSRGSLMVDLLLK